MFSSAKLAPTFSPLAFKSLMSLSTIQNDFRHDRSRDRPSCNDTNCSFSNLRGEALWNCWKSTTHTSKWFQKRALEAIRVSCDFSLSTEGEVSLFWSWNNSQINRRIIYSSRFSKNNAFLCDISQLTTTLDGCVMQAYWKLIIEGQSNQ